MTDYTFHTIESTEGETKDLLQGFQNTYGFVPTLFGYMAEAPVTLAAYKQLNALIAKSSFPQTQAQIALLAASIENKCEFCTVAHHAMALKFGAHEQSIHALLNNQAIEDTQDKEIVAIVQEIIQTRGWVSEEKLNTFYAAGFAPQQYFELILVVTIKTLSNYINHQTQPHANQELLDMIA